MPIDYFFRSLAEEQQEKAIGILLSGTGTDGTLGLKAIKGYGGMTMAQDPNEAQYNGMVRSAINAGLVDYVLSIEQMPAALLQYLRHAPHLQNQIQPVKKQDALREILKRLRKHKRYDFRCYKEGTLLRRIIRRMGLQHIDDMAEYNAFLRQHPDEINKLFKDLLISVTAFFRDPPAFQALSAQVVEKLVREKAAEAPLRIWVPGCATGEEAYSLAILFTEQFEAAHKEGPLQIFATDIDEAALEVARSGVYPENIAADVSDERLRRFFIKEAYHLSHQ
jgi:two-component system, chemotaxis family, CheB/CheR fusion protein